MDDHIEEALSGVQTSMYLVVAPQELLTVTASYVTSMVFYTDGSLIDGCAGFDIHPIKKGGFGYKLSSPFVTSRHIEEVDQPPEKCLILTDSVSPVKVLLFRKISHWTHPLVYELV
jgi:hypothetical protein